MGFTRSGDKSGSKQTLSRNRTAGRHNLEADHGFVNWLDFIQRGASMKVAIEKHSITMRYHLLSPAAAQSYRFFLYPYETNNYS